MQQKKEKSTEDPTSMQIDKKKKPKLKPKYIKWTTEENEIYLDCLEEYLDTFVYNIRRLGNIYKMMSIQMNESKSNVQCRSHHHKMMLRYGSVRKIINHFR